MNRRSTGIRFYLWGACGLVAATIIVIVIVHGRYADVAIARDTLEANAAQGPRVQVIAAVKSPEARDVKLLGDARPNTSVTLFSKVAGYLKTISVDKGDQVKAGQVLAICAVAAAVLPAELSAETFGAAIVGNPLVFPPT